MTAHRKIALVAVGVDSTRVLPRLSGAAAGAVRVAAWLESQRRFGVDAETRVLTDRLRKPVSLRAVQDTISEIVKAGGVDLLLLYFAGHGLVKSGGDEQLLLSEVDKYAHEAIDIASTAANARYCTVPHVVIVSDACRNAVDPYSRLGQVSGAPALYRGNVVGAKKASVDIFYATEPSQTAKEYKGDGFFTSIMLEALSQCPEEVCETWRAQFSDAVIPSWLLEEYLYREVPLRASQQQPPFDQSPDIIVTSRQPQFLGFASARPGVTPQDAELQLRETESRTRGRRIRLDDAVRHSIPPLHSTRRSKQPSHQPEEESQDRRRQALVGIKENMTATMDGELPDDLLEAAGLLEHVNAYIAGVNSVAGFAGESGYSVRGTHVIRTLMHDLKEPEIIHWQGGQIGSSVRIDAAPGERKGGSILLFFSENTVAVLPVMPGHIGTLDVRDGRVQSISFDVAAAGPAQFGLDERRKQNLVRRRAVASALAATGKLRHLGRQEWIRFATFLREDKRIDPTLGIYAAYACALAGNEEAVVSIGEAFGRHMHEIDAIPAPPIPFDVVMLAGKLYRALATDAFALVPFCPMMSLGWSLMEASNPDLRLHPAILDAGQRRLNAEWTTFRETDIHTLITAFEQGEIQ